MAMTLDKKYTSDGGNKNEGLATPYSIAKIWGGGICTHVLYMLVLMDRPFSTKFWASPFTRHGDTPKVARDWFTKLKTRELISTLGGELESFCTWFKMSENIRSCAYMVICWGHE